jgi:RNA-directed DNA polymerase
VISRASGLSWYAPHPQPVGKLAGVLADAFLAVRWRRAELLRAGATVLGRRAVWIPRVVDGLLLAYREAPADRPRELAGYLAEVLAAPVNRRLTVRRSVVRRRLFVPVRTVRMRWGAPAIDHLGALAAFLGLSGEELDWFADRREINRLARDEQVRHYRYAWLPHRLIEAPKPRLRAMQRRLLDEVLAALPVHDRAHGFVPGRGVHTFAASHAGRDVLVKLDLRAFFSSITAGRVYGVLRGAGYPEPVAHALTALTTTRTPAYVLRKAPDATRAALLRRPHLPQGAPTSPALANLCAFRLDRRLTGLADTFGVHYSRYADDLAFSGSLRPRQIASLIGFVETIAAQEDFRVHPDKTRVRGRGERQQVAGLIVNHHPAVPREDYDRLRAVLHDATVHGLDSANREGHADFAAHLAGRVAWMSHRHPSRAAKLHRMLQAAIGG